MCPPLKFECDNGKSATKASAGKDSERTSKITSLFCISKLYSYSFLENINQGLVHCFVNFISAVHISLKAIIVLVNTDLQVGDYYVRFKNVKEIKSQEERIHFSSFDYNDAIHWEPCFGNGA